MPERKFTLIVPRQDNLNTPIKKEYLEYVATQMIDQFGGVTVFESNGCFRPEGAKGQQEEIMCDNNLVLEAVMGVDENSDTTAWKQVDEAVTWMKQLAKKVADDLGQVSVFTSAETDARTEFVRGEYSLEADSEFLDPDGELPPYFLEGTSPLNPLSIICEKMTEK